MDSSGYGTGKFTTGQGVIYAGDLAQWALSDGDNLIYYLKVLSRFSQYTLNNQLLIMGYKPDAVFIKGMDEWNELGIRVNDVVERPIYIIEPVKDTENGKREFAWKIMYDATDTNYDYRDSVPDKFSALEALLTNREHVIEVVDEIKQNVRAMYMPDTGKILVKRSSQAPPDEFFNAIAAEMVHAKIAEKSEGAYNRGANQLTAMATAYALGTKYGIDTGNIRLQNLPERYAKLSAKDAKEELGKISQQFEHINANMTKSLDVILKREMSRNERQQT